MAAGVSDKLWEIGDIVANLFESEVPMVHKHKVVRSFNMEGELRCVDVFQRIDGTYGFEEYRRDPEDGRGWFAIGYYGEQQFCSSSDALVEAQKKVLWLADVVAYF